MENQKSISSMFLGVPRKYLPSTLLRSSLFGLATLLERYFRLDIITPGNLPKSGPILLIANHSGFAGFDALLLAHTVERLRKRPLHIMAHRAYFDVFQGIANMAKSLGLIEPHVSSALKALKRHEALLIFPEAESGNFKSSRLKYRLQPFHSGFIRLAVEAGIPVTPVIITGAEEANLTLGNLDLRRYFRSVVVPLPLNLLPLPAKWRIEFLPPIDVREFGTPDLTDWQWVSATTSAIEQRMQETLSERLKQRAYVYVPGF
jgi:1-acyl-sn-glycerol-3-phosphate acyltransferase